MKEETPQSSEFKDILQEVLQKLSPEQKKNLPRGLVMLEPNGTMSSMFLPMDDENFGDVISAMIAMEFLLFAFERDDWMAEYFRCLKEKRQQAKESEKLAKKLTLIKGGLEH
jgi:hypothetical protein